MIYFAGLPPGRVQQLKVPAFSREIELSVLDRATVTWTLAWRDERPGCEAGWSVASARVVPGSASTEDVTWVF